MFEPLKFDCIYNRVCAQIIFFGVMGTSRYQCSSYRELTVFFMALVVSHDEINPIPEAGDAGIDVGIIGVALATSPGRQPSQQEATISDADKGAAAVTLWIIRL